METMFFVEFVGTAQGTVIEKQVKDFCNEQFNHSLCTAAGRLLIYGKVVEFAQKLHNANPKTVLPAIVLSSSDGDLCFPSKNAIDNFRILSFKRCAKVVLGPDEQGVAIINMEAKGGE